MCTAALLIIAKKVAATQIHGHLLKQASLVITSWTPVCLPSPLPLTSPVWASLLPGASQPHRCQHVASRGDLWPGKGPAPLLRSLVQVASEGGALVEMPQQAIPGPGAAMAQRQAAPGRGPHLHDPLGSLEHY